MATIDIRPYMLSSTAMAVEPSKAFSFISGNGAFNYPTFGVAATVTEVARDIFYLRSDSEVVGSDAYIGRYAHQGQLFDTEVLLPFKGYLHSMAVDPYGRIVVLAHDGSLYHTSDFNKSGFVKHATDFGFGTTGVVRLKWSESLGFYFNVGALIYYSFDGINWNTRPGPGAGKTGPVVVDTVAGNERIWYFDNQAGTANLVWVANLSPSVSTFTVTAIGVGHARSNVEYNESTDVFVTVSDTGNSDAYFGHPERTWTAIRAQTSFAKGMAKIGSNYYIPYYSGLYSSTCIAKIAPDGTATAQTKTIRTWRDIANVTTDVYFAGGVGRILVNSMSDTVDTYYTVTGAVTEVTAVPKAGDPTARVSVEYPKFSAQAIAENPIVASGALAFQAYRTAGQVDLPIGGFATAMFGKYSVAGVFGAFPKEYPIYEWKVTSVIAAKSSLDMAIADPTTPFTVGDWSYPGYSVDFNVTVLTEAQGDWTYPVFEIFGGTRIEVEESEFIYPIFGIDADLVNANLVRSANRYPAFDAEVNVRLTIPTETDAIYPNFRFRGVVTSNTIKGDIVFATYSVSAKVVPYEATGEFQYPNYGIAGEMQQHYVTGEFSYPAFEVEGETGNTRGVRIEATYAAFEASGELYQPVWIVGENQYPTYGVDGELDVPIGAIVAAEYAQYRVSGLGGLFVSVKDTDIPYPAFRFAGRTAFTTSIDAAIRYPVYRIAADLGRNPKGDIAVTYPKFTAAAELENYYGASMNVDNEVELESSADVGKSRRTLTITEL